MWYGSGTIVRTSTQTEQTNPSTSTLLAEVTGLGGEANRGQMNYEARILAGCSTGATLWLEQCQSSGLAASALRESSGHLGRVVLYVQPQTAQYVVRFRTDVGDRIRVRPAAAVTGTAHATIQVEAMV